VTAVLEERRATLEAMGCIVEEIEPDLGGADEAFETLRALATRSRSVPSSTAIAAQSVKDTDPCPDPGPPGCDGRPRARRW
jgi:hypothetical protein